MPSPQVISVSGQRLHDLAGLGIDIGERVVLIGHEGGGAKVHGVTLDHLGHLLDHLALLPGEHALHGELRLGEVDTGLGVGLADADLRHHLVDAAALGEQALHIVGELAEGARGQIQHHRENLALAEDVQHAAVLAGFCLAFAGAVLVVGASFAVAAGVAQAGHAVEAAAVRRVVAALVLIGVVREGGVVVQDHTGEGLHHLRLVPVAGQFQDGGSARSELDAVELEVQPLAVLGHDLVHQGQSVGVGVAANDIGVLSHRQLVVLLFAHCDIPP